MSIASTQLHHCCISHPNLIRTLLKLCPKQQYATTMETHPTIVFLTDTISLPCTNALQTQLCNLHPSRGSSSHATFRNIPVSFCTIPIQHVESYAKQVSHAVLVVLVASSASRASLLALVHADTFVREWTTNRIWVVVKGEREEIGVKQLVSRWRRIVPNERPLNWFWVGGGWTGRMLSYNVGKVVKKQVKQG